MRGTTSPTSRQTALRAPEPTDTPGCSLTHGVPRPWPHIPARRHWAWDPRACSCRDSGTQLCSPADRHQPQKPWAPASASSEWTPAPGQSQTHSLLCQDPFHPPAGQHQLWDQLALPLTTSGPTSASGQPGPSQLCQELAPPTALGPNTPADVVPLFPAASPWTHLCLLVDQH